MLAFFDGGGEVLLGPAGLAPADLVALRQLASSGDRESQAIALLFRFELALQTICDLIGREWLPNHRPELLVDLQILRESVRRDLFSRRAQRSSAGAGAGISQAPGGKRPPRPR